MQEFALSPNLLCFQHIGFLSRLLDCDWGLLWLGFGFLFTDNFPTSSANWSTRASNLLCSSLNSLIRPKVGSFTLYIVGICVASSSAKWSATASIGIDSSQDASASSYFSGNRCKKYCGRLPYRQYPQAAAVAFSKNWDGVLSPSSNNWVIRVFRHSQLCYYLLSECLVWVF